MRAGRRAGGTAGGLLVLALLLGAGPLWAHEGRALAPHDFWGAWSFEPAVVLGLLVSGGLYARGMRELRRVARRRLLRREGRCFWSGWLLLALALVSPLHALGEALFAAHMAQHELIMAVAAPLLVLGRPLVVMLWAFPLASRRAIGALGRARALRGPWHLMSAAPVAFALHAAAILVWHLPRLYQWAVASETVHALQHTAFLVTALLFWWALLEGPRARLRYGAAVLYLFGTAVYTGGLGALLTVSRALWYPLYASRTGPWGFSPLEDQQLAGLIMWVPAGLAYLGAALALTAAWLREAEWRVARREAAPLLRGR